MPERSGLAAPLQNDGVFTGDRKSKIGGDAGRQRRNAPAVSGHGCPVAAADAIRVLVEVDDAGAPVRDIDRLRWQQRHARVALCRRRRLDFEQRRDIGEGHAVHIVACRQPHQRQIDVIGPLQREVEGAVAVRAIRVRFREQDVEHHRARLLRLYPLQEFRVYRARPRPFAGRVVHAGETLLVDIDDDDVRIRLELRRMAANEEIGDPVFEAVEQVEPPDFQRSSDQHDDHAGVQRPAGQMAKCGRRQAMAY